MNESQERRVLLAVLAHPDDESYGIGGTLARYAAEGVDTHVVIATDGAAGSVDERWQGDRSRLAEARTRELQAAAEVLGVTVHMLCYRDSGYVGDLANEHPAAFVNVDEHEAIGRIVQLIRRLRPQVIVTHDETGGYFHPDHIHCNKITTAAFHAASDPEMYPELGLDLHAPQRLYFSGIPKSRIRLYAFLMRLRGLDPTKVGRNGDVDITRIGLPGDRLTTNIDYRPYWDVKRRASAKHRSQGGGTSFNRMIPRGLRKLLLGTEMYVRVYPPVRPGYQEKDFFNSL